MGRCFSNSSTEKWFFLFYWGNVLGQLKIFCVRCVCRVQVSNAAVTSTFWVCAARQWSAYQTAPMNHHCTRRDSAFGRKKSLLRCSRQHNSLFKIQNSNPSTEIGWAAFRGRNLTAATGIEETVWKKLWIKQQEQLGSNSRIFYVRVCD